MMEIKIPVENNKVIIGDLFVDVNIEIKPVMRGTVEENIALDRVNGMLGSLSWEIKQDIKKKIYEKLNPTNKE